MPKYTVLDKDTIKSEIMPHLSVAKRGYFSHQNKTEDKGCDKIKITRSDIKEMLDNYLYEYIDYVDLDFISEECTEDMVEYIQNGTNEVVFEDD